MLVKLFERNVADSDGHAECLAFVAAPAILEVQVIAKGASSVMARHTAKGAPRREVLSGARRAHLP